MKLLEGDHFASISYVIPIFSDFDISLKLLERLFPSSIKAWNRKYQNLYKKRTEPIEDLLIAAVFLNPKIPLMKYINESQLKTGIQFIETLIEANYDTWELTEEIVTKFHNPFHQQQQMKHEPIIHIPDIQSFISYRQN